MPGCHVRRISIGRRLRWLHCAAEASLVGLEPLIVNLKKKVKQMFPGHAALQPVIVILQDSTTTFAPQWVNRVPHSRRYGGSTSKY